MISLFKTCLDFAFWFNDLLNKLLQPNPKYTPKATDQQLQLVRNKGIALLHTIISFMYLSEIFINGCPVEAALFRAFCCIAILFCLYLSCVYHPLIFKITYTFICSIYGPILMNSSPEGVHIAWATSSALPALQYVFMGGVKYYIFQFGLQIFLANTIFAQKMQETVMQMSPEDFVRALKQGYISVFVIHSIVILFMNHMMIQVTGSVLVAEKGRTEAENQKTFLFTFTHELRNLINSISGNIKLAAQENHIPTRIKELLSNAEVCSELLFYLVNNILDTGKMEAGELDVDLRPTNMYSSLEKIWSVCSELIQRRGLRGVMKIQNDLPKTLQIDPYRLTQIFINLVGNSIKFTEGGAVNITVEWLKDCTEVTMKCFEPYPFNEEDDQDEGLFEKFQGFTHLSEQFPVLYASKRKIDSKSMVPLAHSKRGVLKVSVTDTGCGMNKDQTDRLFHKFIQVSTDASKRKLGTGLGLFIVKQICARLNGDVKVFSKENTGSCFVFCIPMDTALGI